MPRLKKLNAKRDEITSDSYSKANSVQLNKLCYKYLHSFVPKDIAALVRVLKEDAIEKKNISSIKLIISFFSEISSIIKNSKSDKDVDNNVSVRELCDIFGIDTSNLKKDVEERKKTIRDIDRKNKQGRYIRKEDYPKGLIEDDEKNDIDEDIEAELEAELEEELEEDDMIAEEKDNEISANKEQA
jgi:hypothetical protein